MTFKQYHPPHIFVEDDIYFITARTKDKVEFFNTDQKKEILKEILNKTAKKFQVGIYTWVILDNHYHLLMNIKLDAQIYLGKFIKSLHGSSAVQLNKLDQTSGRKIWVNYWDRCIRSEKDFWTRFNYIHHNPVKHDYVKRMEDYKFSSYNHYLKKYGDQWMADCLRQYPIIDFTPTGEV